MLLKGQAVFQLYQGRGAFPSHLVLALNEYPLKVKDALPDRLVLLQIHEKGLSQSKVKQY
jgi:hypothetical protein